MHASAWDSVFLFGHEEVHLMGHGRPVRPVKVKYKSVYLASAVAESVG